MKKIPVDKLIDFRRKKLDRAKITVLKSTQKEKEKKADGSGGNYWVSCLSAIINLFIDDSEDLIGEKIDDLRNRIKRTQHVLTKQRWQKNIDILFAFQEYDMTSIKPAGKLTFLKKPKDKSILKIKDVLIESNPSHVFTFLNNGFEEIGAVWFVIKKDGFNKSELGMFTDIMYRYLILNYSDKFIINPKYCITIDLVNCQEVNYYQLLNGDISFLLDNTIDEVKKLFKN